ncbi:type IV pilus twitching motility protein PilT [Candidatus Saccharibacteria bacterium]|nr:type IV pilus twitching motility protein PilT [Candidatus Saccharibacteria bacterium]
MQNENPTTDAAPVAAPAAPATAPAAPVEPTVTVANPTDVVPNARETASTTDHSALDNAAPSADTGSESVVPTTSSIAAAAAAAATPTAVPSSVRIEVLLEECIKKNASDLHIQVGLPPILRVDGALQPIQNTPVLNEDMIEKLVFSTLDSMQRETLSKDKEFDYSFSFGDIARFRVNAFNEKGNLAAAFRLIPTKMPTVDELGMPQVVSTFSDFPRGLVLVTGPTGSGKSTTLAALINKINTEKSVHIVTIEDPIEFTHKSKRSVIVQREVHYDTFSFARALKSALRQDPDVVLLGEMRDLETISSAITIAETGHLVFATLHTNSAAQSIDRMIDVFPAEQQPQIRSQLSAVLMAVCSQRLVPAIGGGRVVAAEIMIANSAVRSIIREGKTHQLDTTIQTGANEGMQTMDRTLAKLVQQGTITYDNAREYAVDMHEFERLVKGV